METNWVFYDVKSVLLRYFRCNPFKNCSLILQTEILMGERIWFVFVSKNIGEWVMIDREGFLRISDKYTVVIILSLSP